MKKITKQCEICGVAVTAPSFYFENSKVSDICILFNKSGAKHIEIERKKLYDKIPVEKKQLFLDNFWKGKSIEESYKTAGLNQEKGFAIFFLNTVNLCTLRREPI